MIRVIMRQILEGLCFIHSKNIIHRNIKGDNIMMHSVPVSGKVILKIADFGEVKQISKSSQKQMTVSTRGTPPFMAPELYLGIGKEDTKVDMWSLGMLLYQMLTHTFPFNSMNEYEIGQISAAQALQHPFFTGKQALAEITQEQFQIAQVAIDSQSRGNQTISQFDTDPKYIFPLTEVQKIIGPIDPIVIMEKFKAQIIEQPYNEQQKQIQPPPAFNIPPPPNIFPQNQHSQIQLQECQGSFNHKTSNVIDILLNHIDESGNLDTSYYTPVLTIPNNKFFSSLNVTSVFPDVHFYVIIAHLDLKSNIILEQISAQPSLDHFALIMRHHPQNINILRSYFEEELKSYQDLEIQSAHDLIYIGFSPLQDGCCVVFLTSSTLTLETGIQQGLLLNNLIKLQITKSLIDSIQYAHQNNIIGFDIRTNTILITQDINKLSIALIGYVGQKDQLVKHPDNENIQWDSKQTAPELLVKKRKGSKISYPTTASDIYSLDPIKQM
ncbi:MAG: hypothetical protein EZS28_010240 [Streblomastix strix]|uniref:Protein kinase domain-containing protein n=1 Tax=Streblomastix strix TaxID=222440 RepID=A0A5J4WGP8_9EUKA|nr:MAG: hypothetical protein EZS28_010240 [Streblomastix strix]